MKMIVLVISLMAAGCAQSAYDHRLIKDLAGKVDTYDGIDRVEATILAQDFIIRRSLYDRLKSLEPYRVTRKVVWYKDGQPIIYVIPPQDRAGIEIERKWELFFKDKRYTFLGMPSVPFYVMVDADDGTIKEWGIKKLREELDIYSYRKYYEGDQL